MKRVISISGLLIFIFFTLFSCIPDSKEGAVQSSEDSTLWIAKNEQEGEIQWINKKEGFFIDSRDNKSYKIVKINNQVWFAENLAYKPATGNFWAFNNDSANISDYGYLYFWETAIAACPTGWHIPSYADWEGLINFLGGKSVAGGKLKASNDWNSPNLGATNSSRLNILPGGNRAVGGNFYHLGDDALLWTGTTKSSRSAWKIRLNYNADTVGFEACSRYTGLSVRCIMDR